MGHGELVVGDVVHGFCQGVFGRDHYTCSVIEALGPDWVVVRDPNGDLDFAAGHDSLATLAQHRERTFNYDREPCCEPSPADHTRAQAAAANRKLARIGQMATAWEEQLPDTIRTAVAVEALRTVIQEQP
jgi:hypothetical protein